VIIFESNYYFQRSIPASDHVSCVWAINNLFGKAKVDELDIESGRVNHDVLWLDVPVHDVQGVEVGKG
jgi:hypothetical protein